MLLIDSIDIVKKNKVEIQKHQMKLGKPLKTPIIDLNKNKSFKISFKILDTIYGKKGIINTTR